MRRHIHNWLIIIFSLIFGSLAAQESIPFEKDSFPDRTKAFRKARRNLRKGDRKFESGPADYKEALHHYKKAYKFNPENAPLNYKIGVIHFRTNKRSKAGEYFRKAYNLDPNANKNLPFVMGEYYQYMSRLDSAIKMYEKYSKKLLPEQLEKEKEKIDKRIRECKTAKKMIKDPERVFIDNLGEGINSEYPDYGPIINADETKLYFTSQRTGTMGSVKRGDDFGYMEDIFVVRKEKKEEWAKPKNPGEPINSDEHDGIIGMAPDGQKMFLYKNDRGGDIYYSTLEGNQWDRPDRISRDINTKAHEAHASLSYDGKTMYYISDKEGGYGKHDIYVSQKDENGNWKEGKNIGAMINTKYDELSVFIHLDGKTLYFSSNGHNTMGGYDIFKTERKDGEWTEPENMDYPVNTTGDDVYISVMASGEHAYISSVRTEGEGSQDIYKVTFLGPEKKVVNTTEDQLIAYRNAPVTQTEIEEAVEVKDKKLTLMTGVVTDSASGEPVEATITLTDNSTNEEIATFESNAETGKYLVTLPAGKNYGISVRAEDYLFYSENVDLREKQNFRKVENNIQLQKIEIGKSIVLRNIFFDTDKATLRDASKAELERLYDIMKNNPEIRVEISGHTDNVSSASYNKELSKERAKSVVDYLVDKGIKKSRMEYAGYGFEQPIATNKTEEGRQKNRRTEFKIISK